MTTPITPKFVVCNLDVVKSADPQGRVKLLFNSLNMNMLFELRLDPQSALDIANQLMDVAAQRMNPQSNPMMDLRTLN